MSETKFINGLIIKAPRDNAPDFVKCSISIKRAELINWLQSESDEWINCDVKISRSGKWYASVNDWKPANNQHDSTKDPELDDEIPF